MLYFQPIAQSQHANNFYAMQPNTNAVAHCTQEVVVLRVQYFPYDAIPTARPTCVDIH